MVVRIAHIKDGIIENVSRHPEGVELPENTIELTDNNAGIGWSIAGGVLTPPEPEADPPYPLSDDEIADLRIMLTEWRATR